MNTKISKIQVINLCVLNEAAYGLARTGQCVLPEGYTPPVLIQMPIENCPLFLQGDCLPIWGFTTKGPSGNLYIVFRGTLLTSGWRFGQEWAEDLLSLPLQAIDNSHVHCGFYQAWKVLRTSVLQAIAKQSPLDGTNYIFTGHSLGAAIASLFFVSEHNTLPSSDLVTFGSPRVGDAKFSNYLWRLPRTLRVVNEYDVVPKVPTDPPFRHGGSSLIVSAGNWNDPKDAHSLTRYQEGVSKTTNW